MVLAGGTESMTNAPYLLKGARWGYRMGHGEAYDTLIAEGLTCAMGGCHMGITAENIASRFNVSREDQDAYAAESQRRADAAIRSGLFREEIVRSRSRKGRALPSRLTPTSIHAQERPRKNSRAMKPAFKKDGSVTAGNASGINDGAAAVVVVTSERAQTARAQADCKDPVVCLDWRRSGDYGDGPCARRSEGARRAKLKASQIDLFELNEAFAVQAVAVMRELGLSADKVNTRGGAISLGHPIGASGARVLTTLIYALRARGGGKGVASLCIGGGMGIAMVIEVA